MNDLKKTVEVLWRDLVDSHFDEEDFIRGVKRDCGLDCADISESDFCAMLNTGSCPSMHEMGWCCNEALAYYLADHLGAAQFVRAIFVAQCGVRAVEVEVAHWDFLFDKIVMLLVQNMDKTDYQFRMGFLRNILCRKPEENSKAAGS